MSDATNRTARGAGTDPRIIRYADGLGNWRAYVPDTFASPIIAARRAIRHELFTRSDQSAETLAHLTAYTRKRVRLHPRQDRPGYLHYHEAP